MRASKCPASVGGRSRGGNEAALTGSSSRIPQRHTPIKRASSEMLEDELLEKHLEWLWLEWLEQAPPAPSTSNPDKDDDENDT